MNLLGHYPAVTGAPARFILRIGWANGRHRAGVPCDGPASLLGGS